MRVNLPRRSAGPLHHAAAAGLAAALLLSATACARDTEGADAAKPPEAKADTCPDDLSPKKATGKPIEIGNVSSLTGPGTFPEASQAAKAVFDRLNECGGVGGRPVRLHVEDDQGDPAVSSQVARRLVEKDNVVLNVGSASLVDCSVNSTYYVKKQLRAIQGTGVDPVCFNSPNIAPVNTGPFTGVTVSLYYASEVLKKDRVCRLRLLDIPGFDSAYDDATTRWEKIAKKKITYVGKLGAATDDITPLLLRAKQRGCQAVVVDGVEPHALAVGKAIKANKLTDITWLGLTSYYTENIAKQLGAAGDGLYANAEFEPFTDAENDSRALIDLRGLLRKHDLPLTSFAEGGYLAATIAQEVLLSIDGEVTRESVGRALLDFRNYFTDLTGSAYTFGKERRHAPNQSSKFVVVKGGKWATTTAEWVTLPAGS